MTVKKWPGNIEKYNVLTFQFSYYIFPSKIILHIDLLKKTPLIVLKKQQQMFKWYNPCINKKKKNTCVT